MLLKQYVFLTCQWTHVNLIYGLYEIFYKPVCKKFLSENKRVNDVEFIYGIIALLVLWVCHNYESLLMV